MDTWDIAIVADGRLHNIAQDMTFDKAQDIMHRLEPHQTKNITVCLLRHEDAKEEAPF